MYIKIINPATNGRNAYSNKGSARQASNYLEKDAKKQGHSVAFFNSSATDLSGDQIVRLLDTNHKGLRLNDVKFYSLVISPSERELEHINNDSTKLRAYTTDVMHAYAENFVLKNGQKLTEKDLVWVATQHNYRVARGTDDLPSGTVKPGLQTHIHIMVSARDAQQKTTLSPLGAAARFNRVHFMAAGNLIFEQKFSYKKISFASISGEWQPIVPPPSSPQTVQQRAEEIRHRKVERQKNSLAGGRRKRESEVRNLTSGELDQAQHKRLQAQVDRINLKLSPEKQLDFEQVKAAGEQRAYDKTFHGRLSRIGREATASRPVIAPYHLLATGKANPVLTLPAPGAGDDLIGGKSLRSLPPRPTPGRALHDKLLSGIEQLSNAMASTTHTKDVRGEWERD
ncbi:DUF5712 family protein [Hymenobacter metallicola]|uniref:DUF5712 family protein n=1 Tax=Hymenobacter metallicola TaxID=2563114 RepID=UPI00198256A6|nr:DUF5712 family protein [Hymenobacter metallicola]